MTITKYRFLPGSTKKLVNRTTIDNAGHPVGAAMHAQVFGGPYVDLSVDMVRQLTISIVSKLNKISPPTEDEISYIVSGIVEAFDMSISTEQLVKIYIVYSSLRCDRHSKQTAKRIIVLARSFA